MKRIFILALLSGLVFGFSKNEKSLIDKVIWIISSPETIEYDAFYWHVDSRMGFDRADTAICYFDFSSDDSLLGAKYQFDSNFGENVYNGEIVFKYYHEIGKVLYNRAPKIYDVSNSFFMVGSIYTFRKLLPLFQEDSSITIVQKGDTTIAGVDCFQFNIEISMGYIDIGSKITPGEGDSNYYLLVTKGELLPFEFGHYFPEDVGYSKTRFMNYKFGITRPDSIWSYDRYPAELERKSNDDWIKGKIQESKIDINEDAPDWSLIKLNGEEVTLSDLNVKHVLLEFWYPGCSPCKQAIPELNSIYSDFKDKGFRVFGIEMQNAKKEFVLDYATKNKIEYPVLLSGKSVAEAYRVVAAPTFILIDSDGKIIYSDPGYKEGKLRRALQQYLE